MSFRILKVVTNSWENAVEVSVIKHSDSELDCYKEALELQKAVFCDAGSPIWVYYDVEEET